LKPSIIKKVAKDVEKILGYRPEVELVQAAIERYISTPTDELRSIVGQLLVVSKKQPVKAEAIMERDEATIALGARQYEDPIPKVERFKPPEPKPKKKPKRLDRIMVRFLESEKSCFDPTHKSEIERLTEQCAKFRENFTLLNQQLEDALARQKLMVDKALLEEAEKTAYAKGLHDGQPDEEDTKKLMEDMVEAARTEGIAEGRRQYEVELRSIKRCFDAAHGMYRDAVPQQLNFSQVLRLFEEQRRSSMMANAGGSTISVLVPLGRVVQESEMARNLNKEIEQIMSRMIRGS